MHLSAEEFKRAATLGLGRAILHARQPSVVLDEELIRGLMLHNTAYDPQMEGTRGWYVMQLIQATHHEEAFIEALRKAIEETPPNDDWDEVQRLWIAGLFVEAGHDELRTLLYDRTIANIDAGYWVGIEAIANADGAAGIEFLVDHVTRDGYDLADLYDSFIYIFDDEDEIHDLPVVQKLRDLAEAARAAWKKSPPRRPTYQAFKDELAKKPAPPLFSPGEWIRHASDEDLHRAAADLLALPDGDSDRWLAYLSIFTKRPFPLDPGPLIALARQYQGGPVWTAEHKVIPETMIPFQAFVVLEWVNHPAVRAFSLENIEKGMNLGHAVSLLESNFQPGDWPMIGGVVDQDHLDDVLHWLGLSVRKIAREHPDPDAAPALTSLIERDPCSACRYDLLRELGKIGPLPEHYRAEALYDSNEDTREWAEAGFPEDHG